MVKRKQPFSQRIIICHRHWHYSISTSINRSHLCYKSIINYDLDITNILVVSPQIRYIEVFDITNPPFNEQIWPVPSDFVKSRFHCTYKRTGFTVGKSMQNRTWELSLTVLNSPLCEKNNIPGYKTHLTTVIGVNSTCCPLNNSPIPGVNSNASWAGKIPSDKR